MLLFVFSRSLWICDFQCRSFHHGEPGQIRSLNLNMLWSLNINMLDSDSLCLSNQKSYRYKFFKRLLQHSWQCISSLRFMWNWRRTGLSWSTLAFSLAQSMFIRAYRYYRYRFRAAARSWALMSVVENHFLSLLGGVHTHRSCNQLIRWRPYIVLNADETALTCQAQVILALSDSQAELTCGSDGSLGPPGAWSGRLHPEFLGSNFLWLYSQQ